MRIERLLLSGVLVAGFGLMAGCGEDEPHTDHADAAPGGCPAGQVCIDEGDNYCADETASCVVPDAVHNYLITMDVGHIHIFREVAITFTVQDLDDCTDPDDTTTCAMVPGLDVVAFYRAESGSSAREQALEAGRLEDNNDGTYTYMRTFGGLEGTLVGLKFEQDGNLYFESFPIHTSRAGGERFFCDADADSTNDYAYQIRWNASTAHIHASGEDVTFQIEMMRSFNTPLNETQPWMNSFQHLRSTEITDTGGLPVVKLMADTSTSSTEVATLDVSYAGRGIYEVTYPFAEADLGGADRRTFWLDVSFTDDQGCLVQGSDDEEQYHFEVAAPH